MSTASAPTATALAQAKLLVEVARRVDRPFDAWPEGDVSGVSLLLWQKAAGSAVLAALADVPATDGQARLEQAAGDAELLRAILASLGEAPWTCVERGGSHPSRCQVLASFTQRLIDELERPERKIRSQRVAWLAKRAVSALVILATVLVANVWISRRGNPVLQATRTVSSERSSCLAGECGTASFHTLEEQEPWVRYDFGVPRDLHAIEIENRADCCYERSVPLIIEISSDLRHWTELQRTEKPFLTFSAQLTGRARYLRLRVAAKTYLHLREVEVR